MCVCVRERRRERAPGCNSTQTLHSVFLIDHAWTYRAEHARQQLRRVPGLLHRMANLMGIAFHGEVPDEGSIEQVLQEMWKYNQTYQLSQGVRLYRMLKMLGWRCSSTWILTEILTGMSLFGRRANLLLGCVGKTTPDLVTLPSVVLQHCSSMSWTFKHLQVHTSPFWGNATLGCRWKPYSRVCSGAPRFLWVFWIKRVKVNSLASALCRMSRANPEQWEHDQTALISIGSWNCSLIGHLYQLSSDLTPNRIKSEKSLRRGFIVTFSLSERGIWKVSLSLSILSLCFSICHVQLVSQMELSVLPLEKAVNSAYS